MIITSADLSPVLDYWSDHRNRYKPSAYALLLCGETSELDRITFDFVVDNQPMLDDMSGPYVSFTLVGRRLDELVRPPRELDSGFSGPDLQYVHAARPSALGSSGVYSLANALDLPLNRLPLLVLSLDPWNRNETLVLSIRNVINVSGSEVDSSEQLADLFALLFTACRTTRNQPQRKRLELIFKHLKPSLNEGGHAFLKSVASSGILAQLIEGVVKGMGFSDG